MGIDVHALNFLRYTKQKSDLGDVMTLARQGFHILESYVKDPYLVNMVRELEETGDNKWCEQMLLKYLGAKKVESIDNSSYEGATYIHDMNTVIPDKFHCGYDTIIDAGTLEHVFNIPLALNNCSKLCRPGGQIIHILPANNFCGHGFWQFTPELFFSLYSEANGYTQTEVYLADVTDINTWYKVHEPKNGVRVNVHTSNRTHILVRTVLKTAEFSHDNVQQSDYQELWNAKNERVECDGEAIPTSLLHQLKTSKLVKIILPLYRSFYRLRPPPTMKLNRMNAGLTRFKVRDLIA